jgi:F-type H+-transporting ATPase subunit b
MEFSFVTFIVTLINLAILFIVMRAILYKPVHNFMAARTAKIKSEVEGAAQNAADAKADRDKAAAELRELRFQQTKMLQDARAEGQRQADAIVEQAKQEAADTLKQGRAELEAEKSAAWAVFQKQAAALVIAAAAKLLKREISTADSAAQAEAFIREAATAANVGAEKAGD